MKEHQHIEWKQSWRDDALRGICGFANAEGGVMVIGRWGEKWGGKWSASVLAKRRKIAETIIQNPRVTITQLATNLGMGTTAIENHLKAMREQRCIRHVGPAKGGHWEVLE